LPENSLAAVDLIVTIFGEPPRVTPAQECARAVLVFCYGLALLRIAGRRIFGKWSALDLVVSIVVGSNLSRALTGTAPLLGTMLATTVLIGLHWILARLAALSAGVARVLEGKPIQIGSFGQIDRSVQRRVGLSEADMHEAIRQNGIDAVEATEKLTLEPSGKLTVIRKPN
jgi:uncharacterized membrane protein YcaP (DUF421 family)